MFGCGAWWLQPTTHTVSTRDQGSAGREESQVVAARVDHVEHVHERAMRPGHTLREGIRGGGVIGINLAFSLSKDRRLLPRSLSREADVARP